MSRTPMSGTTPDISILDLAEQGAQADFSTT